MGAYIFKLAATFGFVKGVILSAVLAAMDVAFWKQLIIAMLSAGIGFAGVVIAAYIAVREARSNRHELRTIKRAVGADRREGDDETDDRGTGSNPHRNRRRFANGGR